jgi:uncharacterized protein
MISLGINAKVAFLSRPESYPGGTSTVETKETHMSWVFLTDFHAWKLKKPVCNEYLDFSTPEARQVDSEQEVTLNRRLAPSIYLGLVPLTVDGRGNPQLGGSEQPIDWLIQMRRLPSDRMLEQAIKNHSWNHSDLKNVGKLLAKFYKNSPAAQITAAEYKERLRADLLSTERELLRSQYALPADFVRFVVDAQIKFLYGHPELFDERVRSGRVIEAHGDLRAEHVCLEQQPVIIDCLEFNRSLRILDTVSELAFLALDCERLGAPEVGEIVPHTYCHETKDHPVREILQFYKSYHACLRAKIAIWHLRDADSNGVKWIQRAIQYLQLAYTPVTAA